MRYSVVITSHTPRACVRYANTTGSKFRMRGGGYFRVSEPYQTASGGFAVWLDLFGSRVAIEGTLAELHRKKNTPHV